MEYTLDKLDDAIYYYLSLTLNKPQSVVTIYNDLCSKNICPDLKNPENREINKLKFISMCRCVISTKFSDIQKVFINNDLYLVLTAYSEDVEDAKDNVNFEDTKYFQPTVDTTADAKDSTWNNHNEIFSYMIDNNNFEHNTIFDDYNNVDTVLHAICRNGNVTLLNKILNLYDIDINSENSLGETLVDVLPKTSDGFAIMKSLIEYDKDKEINELKSRIDSLKEENSSLVKDYVIMQQKIIVLESKYNDIACTLSMYNLMLIGIGFSYFACKFLM